MATDLHDPALADAHARMLANVPAPRAPDADPIDGSEPDVDPLMPWIEGVFGLTLMALISAVIWFCAVLETLP